MIPALGRFVAALRREGVTVSPAELLDAVRAVEAVDLAGRSRFRTALRATLVKSLRERAAFDRVFDRFFVPPRRGSRARGAEAAGAGGGRQQQGSAGGAPAERRPRPDPESSRRRIVPRHPPRDDTRRERATRDRLRALVEDVRGARRVGRLRIVRTARPRGSDASGRQSSTGSTSPVRREISRPMSVEEERELARLVPKLVEELRLRSGRRLRASRRGRLSTRRLFRENLAHGGVPFVLPFRRPRPRRPRVVLLVDVSFSVARAAGLFLRMVAEFLRLGRDARVVAFVDRPVDATADLRSWIARGQGAKDPARPARAAQARRGTRHRPGEGIRVGRTSFADVLDRLHGLNLEAPSDYGRAFHGLLKSQLRPAGRDTVLVILGDGRTNRFDPLPWSLEEIARRCRLVLWLVPEPEERWGTGDSALAGYLPWVDVAVETHDLAGLGRGLAELIRKL